MFIPRRSDGREGGREAKSGGESPRLQRAVLAGALAVLTIAAPRLATACAVCFGDPEAPQRIGANYAILFLVGVTVAMLGGFAVFFFCLKRRAREAGEASRFASAPAPREDSLV